MADNPPVPLESRRMPLETRVLLKFDRFSGFISEFSSNVSQGGMFIRTRTPEPIGTVLDFGFRLGDDYELIHGRGEVVWIRSQDETAERPAGMGIRFIELSAGSRELIRKMVENYVQAGGTPFDVAQAPEPRPATAARRPGPAAEPAPAPALLPEIDEEAPLPAAAPPPEPDLAPDLPAGLATLGGLAGASPIPPAPAPPLPAQSVEEASFLAPSEPAAEPAAAEPWAYAPELVPDPLFDAEAETGPDRAAGPLWRPSSEPDPEPAADPFPTPEPVAPAAPAPAGRAAATEPTPDPEPRAGRTPLPWPVAAAGEPVSSPGEPLAPPAPTHRIDLSPRQAPPVFQAAAAPSAGHGRRLVLIGALAAVVLLVTALLLGRGPLRGLLRLPGSAADAATQDVPPPPERPEDSGSASVTLEPPPEMAGEAAPPPAEPAGAPEPAATPSPPGPGQLAASPGPALEPAAAPPVEPTPAPEAPTAASSTFTAVERITWEQAGGATEIVLWGNGAIRRSDYRQVRVGGEPPREVVKLIGVRQPFSRGRVEVGTAQVRQLRIGFHDKPGADELHVVIDLASPDARVTGIQEETGRLRVRIQ